MSEIQTTEAARLIRGTSPIDGQLGILTLQRSPLRTVDLMSGVYGIRHDELARLCERAPVFSHIKVIDPIFLFRSKCHCLLGLDQSARQDARHVRMMALVLPRYLSLLIEGMETENLGERAILREIKLLTKILGTHACRRALGELEIDPGTLTPGPSSKPAAWKHWPPLRGATERTDSRGGGWQMADGRWQMADGRWQMADGRWQMADGRWQIADGRLRIADCGLRIADRGWRMADGGWRIVDGGLRMADRGWRIVD